MQKQGSYLHKNLTLVYVPVSPALIHIFPKTGSPRMMGGGGVKTKQKNKKM